MEFRRFTTQAQLLNPLLGFEPDSQQVEYRFDPLTGTPCRINIRRAERVRQSQESAADMGDLIERTRGSCFFCPGNIENDTPRFTEGISGEGRIREGESLVFPNLFPFAEYHAVATITREHYLDLDQFTEGMLEDNLKACEEWMVSVHRQDPEARYPMYSWNHMPPSAASIVHPHVQALVDKGPTPYLKRLLDCSRDYHAETGKNYWSELVSEEKRLGERYIGENDSLSVVSSFAPQGNREMQIVFKGVCSIFDLNERHRGDFASCMVKLLRGYKAMGVTSFNLTTFSGPAGEEPAHYSLNAKIISRPPTTPFYTSDSGFMERFQHESIIETLPEDLARRMRVGF